MAELNVKILITGLLASSVWIATISPSLSDLANKGAMWRAGGYIDVHNHLQGWYRESGRFVTDYPTAAWHALYRSDELQIVSVIWMPPPQPFNFRNPIRYTDYLDVVRARPNRFAFLGGGGTLNPLIYESVAAGKVTSDILKQFDSTAEQIVRDGAKGFGEMTALHLSFRPSHPFLAVQPDHPLFKRLADIAARHDMPIDLHMEAVAEDMAPLPRFSSPPNPPVLKENISAFERLLAHNRKARIVWAHIGWDNTGHQTVTRLDRLLAMHSNLYLQVKTGLRPPSRAFRSPGARNRPVDEELRLRPEWLALFRKFPDQIVFASDQFFGIPGRTRRVGRGGNKNEIFAQLSENLARRIGIENPIRIYNLKRP